MDSNDGNRSQQFRQYSDGFNEFFASHRAGIEEILLQATPRSATASDGGVGVGGEAANPNVRPLTLPIEKFLEPPAEVKKQQFLLSVRPNDLLFCRVLSKDQFSSLNVRILAVDELNCDLKRDLCDLDLRGVCLFMNVPKQLAQEAQIGDLLRCLVINCEDGKTVNLSLQSRDLPQSLGHVKLGIVADTELPPVYSLLLKEDPQSYYGFLVSQPVFKNVGACASLCQRLGIDISSHASVMHCVKGIRSDHEHTAKRLREAQDAKQSLQLVAKGVEHFRAASYVPAAQCYEQALALDPGNTEALVARGALHVTKGVSDKAIADFESALKLRPGHRNARLYLAKTLASRANGLLHDGEAKSAILHYVRALHFDPSLQQAMQTLKDMKARDLAEAEMLRSFFRVLVDSRDENSSSLGDRMLQLYEELSSERANGNSRKQPEESPASVERPDSFGRRGSVFGGSSGCFLLA